MRRAKKRLAEDFAALLTQTHAEIKKSMEEGKPEVGG